TAQVYTQSHEILGTVIVGLFLLQPLLGWFHHRHFLAKGAKDYKREVHVWLGRGLMAIGTINGGIGIKLASETDKSKTAGIAYGIIAGLVFAVYLGVWFWSRRQRRGEAGKTETSGNEAAEAGVSG
ncbi:uncharacterized protein BDR25DRAFT_223363, partial [Lindgomyces ingoldianus]